MKNKEKGIALFTTLILALLVLIIISTIYIITTAGIRSSGTVARYTKALEAAKAGTEDILHDIKSVLKNSTLIGAWKPNSLPKLKSEFFTSFPTTPEEVINNYDWHKKYDNYDVYGLLVFTHKNVLGLGKTRYFYHFEIVCINNTSKEKVWFSVLYQLDKTS